MAKLNNTVKLGKMFKIQLANIADPATRTHYKEMMLDAEKSLIASKNRKYVELKSNPNQPRNPD